MSAKLMPEIQRCPKCESEDVHDYWLHTGGVAISCNPFSGCGMHGRYFKTLRGAINAWNRMKADRKGEMERYQEPVKSLRKKRI